MSELIKGMYVRFPNDLQDMNNPRDFLMGRIENINKITETLSVRIYDPFHYGVYFEIEPGVYECSIERAERCSAYIGARVLYNHQVYIVLCCNMKFGRYIYWLQRTNDKSVVKADETEITIPFSCMYISPLVQMKNYELQNPKWYIGRSIVTRSINILQNSISGFTELAGCKIELLPHQLAVILRCMQSKYCRYMLADEVGMGKTIEALGILKIYFANHANKSVLIVVPSALKEQWKSEMLFKFDLSDSLNSDNNRIKIISSEQIDSVINQNWDFLIVDEVHHYLLNQEKYAYLKHLSKATKNVLLLSATPLQDQVNEYLKLVRLLSPERYDNMSIENFEKLVDRQMEIVRCVHDVYGILEDIQQIRDNLKKSGIDIHEDDEAKELFDEILENIEDLNSSLKDEKITNDLMNISFAEKDISVHRIQALLVYVTERYQIMSNIIRNRRSILRERVAHRELQTIQYDIYTSDDQYEYHTYRLLCEWIKELAVSEEDFVCEILPLLKSFFSSAFAFIAHLKEVRCAKVPDELFKEANNWLKYEKVIELDILDAINRGAKESRLIKILEDLNNRIRTEKVILFTDYNETLQFYQKCMNNYFGEGSTAVYSKDISEREKDLAIYNFQNDKYCHFLLCDASGGEGKNFQMADYVVHLDLPWNASNLEQRIGRLDRLGREPDKPVISIVLYEPDTLEDSIFQVFNGGLSVFTKSLSGLEIVMNQLNRRILQSIMNDINYGLKESINEIIEIANKMNKGLKAEQIFDVAGYEFKTLNQKIDLLIQRLYRQDSEVFYNAMEGWATLTGFKKSINKDDDDNVISFSRSNFSYNSAKNTMLIPPDWSKYQNDERSKHIEQILLLVGMAKNSNIGAGFQIKGTFNRRLAIQSEFLHFFAPGDPIFDCIVNNAINSYKGTCSAIKMQSSLNWQGFIFNFTYNPDYTSLYEKGIEKSRINSFLGYLEGAKLRIAIPFYNPDCNSQENVLKEYQKLITPINLFNDNVMHLGRRSKLNACSAARKLGISNAEYFREITREDKWPFRVEQAYKIALNSMTNAYIRRSRLDLAEDEIKTKLSVLIETEKLSEEEIAENKFENAIILKALRNAKPFLDSVLFIWMSKNGID